MLTKVLTLLFGVFASLATADIGSYTPYHPMVDNSTWANIDQVQTQLQFVDWYTNWNTKQLQGFIILDMKIVDETQFVQIDTQNNIIDDVQLLPAGSAMSAINNAGQVPLVNNPLTYAIMSPNPQIGDVLVIELPSIYGIGTTFSVQIYYSTQEGGNDAVNFLNPNQTSGGVEPMLFTYTMDIYGRQIAPQQDTPAIRITWGGCITTNYGMSPYMSANVTGTYDVFVNLYRTCFYNPIPLPNYLMNAVVGNLEMQYVPATGFELVPSYIIAEPSVMQTAINAFPDLPSILYTVQHQIEGVNADMNPYPFGVFRLIVLPPVYPQAGLASPFLTYISETTTYAPANVNDAQQEVVLVRLCAQHWIGALTSHNNWEDFWLTEGYATALERLAISNLWTKKQAYTEAWVGNTSLATYDVLGLQNATYATLHPVLQGANPIDSFSIVPFEKGFQLLDYINEVIDPFLPIVSQGQNLAGQNYLIYYLNRYRFMSICAFTMRFSYSNFVEGVGMNSTNPMYVPLEPNDVNAILDQVDYEEWIYQKGSDPTGTLNYETTDVTAAISLAQAYLAGGGTTGPANFADYNNYYSAQQVVFHQTLINDPATVSAAIMTLIDQQLDITATVTDPEIKQRWFMLGLYLNYTTVFTPTQNWVSSMGRVKYLSPIYQACNQSNGGATVYNMCVGWFNANQSYYTPFANQVVSLALQL